MKLNQEQLKRAGKLIESLKVDKIFVNDKGEFFSSENLALNSVKGKKDKLVVVDRNANALQSAAPAETATKTGNHSPELRGEKTTEKGAELKEKAKDKK